MAKASRVRRYLPVSTCPPPPVASYMEEPALIFAHDMRHVDPKAGLASFGPYSWLPDRRHPGRIRLGIIGTAQTIAAVRSWDDFIATRVALDHRQTRTRQNRSRRTSEHAIHLRGLREVRDLRRAAVVGNRRQ